MKNNICQFCNKEYSKPYCESKKSWSKRKYCSRLCDYNDGYITKNCEKCNMTFSCLKGHKKRRFCSQKCSNSLKNYIQDRTQISDKKGRRSYAYRLFRKSVLKRDDYKCRIADKNCNGHLEVHHILPWSKFPELGMKVNNGITLCRFHHPLNPKDEIRLSPYFQELITNVVPQWL